MCTVSQNRCVGCQRTLKEIESWRTMTELEKKQVINQINKRN